MNDPVNARNSVGAAFGRSLFRQADIDVRPGGGWNSL